MDFSFLSFLAEPLFTIPWFGIGFVGMVWVIFDVWRVNRPLAPPLKIAWPLMAQAFSVIGVAGYWFLARPHGIAGRSTEVKRARYQALSRSGFRDVVAATMVSTTGAGLGIMAAKLASRSLEWDFWTEFWVQAALGFAIGWLVFQVWFLAPALGSRFKALLAGGAVEFISMIGMMIGVGVVSGLVAPVVVGELPEAYTHAFWGFATLGLLLGILLTLPLNWLMLRLGWTRGLA